MSNKYFFKFRNTDTGLAGTMFFTFYKNAATLADITQPAVSELAGGVYYVEPSTDDPETVFQIDGGATIPSDQRYISGTITPKEADVLSRIAGLMHENSVMDSTGYTNGKLTDARVRLYDNSANALAAAATSPAGGTAGLLFEYLIEAKYASGNLKTYTVTRIA